VGGLDDAVHRRSRDMPAHYTAAQRIAIRRAEESLRGETLRYPLSSLDVNKQVYGIMSRSNELGKPHLTRRYQLQDVEY
jgi:hypothetical protein